MHVLYNDTIYFNNDIFVQYVQYTPGWTVWARYVTPFQASQGKITCPLCRIRVGKRSN